MEKRRGKAILGRAVMRVGAVSVAVLLIGMDKAGSDVSLRNVLMKAVVMFDLVGGCCCINFRMEAVVN